MLTRIAPIRAVAYWTRNHSTQFGAQMPTRSPLRDAAGEQAAGELVDRGVQLGVGPAPAGRDVDEGLAVGERGDRAAQVRVDRLAEQRDASSVPEQA